MNPNQPLWLPPGSVRAVLALMLVGVLSYLAVTGQIKAESFIGIVAAVVAFYFGTKAARPPSSE